MFDLATVNELVSLSGRHTKSRFFRSESGVLDMVVDPEGCLYSCGFDGTVKVHSIDLPYS